MSVIEKMLVQSSGLLHGSLGSQDGARFCGTRSLQQVDSNPVSLDRFRLEVPLVASDDDQELVQEAGRRQPPPKEEKTL